MLAPPRKGSLKVATGRCDESTLSFDQNGDSLKRTVLRRKTFTHEHDVRIVTWSLVGRRPIEVPLLQILD